MMVEIMVREIGSNYSEIPTGVIVVESLQAFIDKYDLLETLEENTYIAEWGNGEGEDTFEIEVI